MQKKYLLLVVSFLLTIIVGCERPRDREICCIVDTGFKGELFIIANGMKADEPNPQALENFNDYVYEIGDDATLILDEIPLDFSKVTFSYQNSTPIYSSNISISRVAANKLLIVIH